MYNPKSTIVLLFLMISYQVFSQRLITGRIIDINTKSAVEQVDVSVYKGTGTTTTTENGYFQLTVKPGDSLLIMHPEYKLGLISVPEVDVFSVYVEKVDDYPIYLDGEANLYRYLKKNLHFSPMMKSKRNEGAIIVQLAINTNGEIENCKVLKSFSQKYEQSVLEVFQSIPGNWSRPHNTRSLIFPVIFGFPENINRIQVPRIKLPEGKIMESIIVLAEDF